MRNIIVIVQLALLAFLTGCSGDSADESEAPPTILSSSSKQAGDIQGTQQLLASGSFNFRVDKDITLLLANLPETSGVIKIYHGTDLYDPQNDIYYPDGRTLVASWRPSNTLHMNISFNSNWEGLLFEWLPESGFEKEQYIFFPASGIGNELILAIQPN